MAPPNGTPRSYGPPPTRAAVPPRQPKLKRPPNLASEADPRRYNRKTGYYGYPLQDYQARKGGFGYTNQLQAMAARKGKQ